MSKSASAISRRLHRHPNRPLHQYLASGPTAAGHRQSTCALPARTSTAPSSPARIRTATTMPTLGNPYRQFTGVVVSAGKMMKTVKVRIPGQKWDKYIRKDFPAPYHVLVSDPTESVREGDVVTVRNGWRTSKRVHHVVTSIVAPFGPGISERPPIPTEEEREQNLFHAQVEKNLRKAALGRVTSRHYVQEIAKNEGWVQQLPQHLAEAWQKVKDAGTVRTGVEKEQMPGINERALENVAAAAGFKEKRLEHEGELKKVRELGSSVAEDVARGGKAI